MPQAVRAEVAAGRARERGTLQPAAVLVRAVQENVQDQGVARRSHGRAHRHAKLPVSALRQEVSQAVRSHAAHTDAHRREAVQVQRLRPRLRANVRHAQTRDAALQARQEEERLLLADVGRDGRRMKRRGRRRPGTTASCAVILNFDRGD